MRPVPALSVSAIIVNRDQSALLHDAVRSVLTAMEAAEIAPEVVVVDNASEDDSRQMVAREFDGVQLISLPTNVGFGGAVNEAVGRTSGDWILLLNNDATLAPDALRGVFERPIPADVGAIALQLRFSSRPHLVNSAGIELDVLGISYDRLLGGPVSGPASAPAEVFGTSAGAAVYRRAMLDGIGGFDGRAFLYLEDADVAWRARMQGWRTLYLPQAVAWHHHSASAGHGSPAKYFHVGRNRVRVLARNAQGRHLMRYGPAIVAYDVGYVLYAAVVDRTLAPLRGRVAGLREWRRLRAETASQRRPVELVPRAGFRAALRRRRVWRLVHGRRR
jgi:GT2 family glycosyltransferase